MSDELSSGNVFFLLQTVRAARDGAAETMRTMERYNVDRKSVLYSLAEQAVTVLETYRGHLAMEYELRSRAERTPKRKRVG